MNFVKMPWMVLKLSHEANDQSGDRCLIKYAQIYHHTGLELFVINKINSDVRLQKASKPDSAFKQYWILWDDRQLGPQSLQRDMTDVNIVNNDSAFEYVNDAEQSQRHGGLAATRASTNSNLQIW